MKPARSSRRAIRIVSQCATAEEFVAAFQPYLEVDSLFIATGSPEEPGQEVRFVMTLAGGEMMLHGSGRVLESHRDRSNFYGLRGMKLRFQELDEGSRRVLAALDARTGGHKSRPPPGGPGAAASANWPTDVLECLIYDDPDTEPAATPAMAPVADGRRRATRPRAHRGIPAGDDDVTVVGPPPRPPGAGPARPMPGSPRSPRRPSGMARVQVASQRHDTPAPPHAPAMVGRDEGTSFIVPRPRSEEGGFAEPGHGAGSDDGPANVASAPEWAGAREVTPRGLVPGVPSAPEWAGAREVTPRGLVPGVPSAPERAGAREVTPRGLVPDEHDTGARPAGSWSPARAPGVSGLVDVLDRPTDPLPPERPRGSPPAPAPMEHAPLTQSGPVRVANLRGSGAHHHFERPGLPPGEFTPTPTRPVAPRGIPRPPMPAERTQLVRFRRPGHVQTAAVSATLGALLGLGAGYLLWGMDRGGHRGAAQAGERKPGGGRSSKAVPGMRTIDERRQPTPVDTGVARPAADREPYVVPQAPSAAAGDPAEGEAIDEPEPDHPARAR